MRTHTPGPLQPVVMVISESVMRNRVIDMVGASLALKKRCEDFAVDYRQ
jgi:hypothetical protein